MPLQDPRYLLNRSAIEKALAQKGYRSIRQLAKAVGIHRNTVGDYYSGASRVIPEALEKILQALDLKIGDALTRSVPMRQVPACSIAELIGSLQRVAPDCAFALFGSRARERAKKFSDYDVGVFATAPLEFARFSSMLDLVAAWNEEHDCEVQLVNLCLADKDFLSEISDDLRFLGGNLEAWTALLRQCGTTLYE